jgi:hypothetical protein
VLMAMRIDGPKLRRLRYDRSLPSPAPPWASRAILVTLWVLIARGCAVSSPLGWWLYGVIHRVKSCALWLRSYLGVTPQEGWRPGGIMFPQRVDPRPGPPVLDRG